LHDILAKTQVLYAIKPNYSAYQRTGGGRKGYTRSDLTNARDAREGTRVNSASPEQEVSSGDGAWGRREALIQSSVIHERGVVSADNSATTDYQSPGEYPANTDYQSPADYTTAGAYELPEKHETPEPGCAPANDTTIKPKPVPEHSKVREQNGPSWSRDSY
jgi:hypothetical protein